MTLCSRYEHTPPLFQNLSLLSVKNANKFMSLLFVFKFLSINSELFIPHYNDMYNTRSNNISMIQIPNIISSHSRQGIRWSGGRAVDLATWGGQVARQLFNFQIQTVSAFTAGSGRGVLNSVGGLFSGSTYYLTECFVFC